MNPTDVVCCPICKSSLEPQAPILTPSGQVKSAVLFCRGCGQIAGGIQNFRYDFLRFDRDRLNRRFLDWDRNSIVVLPQEVADSDILFDDPRLATRGRWKIW